jgi:hypothetical protein
MINISQNEKFTESGVPIRPLTSGRAVSQKAFPGKHGKNNFCEGKW